MSLDGNGTTAQCELIRCVFAEIKIDVMKSKLAPSTTKLAAA